MLFSRLRGNIHSPPPTTILLRTVFKHIAKLKDSTMSICVTTNPDGTTNVVLYLFNPLPIHLFMPLVYQSIFYAFQNKLWILVHFSQNTSA